MHWHDRTAGELGGSHHQVRDQCSAGRSEIQPDAAGRSGGSESRGVVVVARGENRSRGNRDRKARAGGRERAKEGIATAASCGRAPPGSRSLLTGNLPQGWVGRGCLERPANKDFWLYLRSHPRGPTALVQEKSPRQMRRGRRTELGLERATRFRRNRQPKDRSGYR